MLQVGRSDEDTDNTTKHCPTELFQAMPGQYRQPLHQTMIQMLRSKFHQFEMKVQKDHEKAIADIKDDVSDLEIKNKLVKKQNNPSTITKNTENKRTNLLTKHIPHIRTGFC